MTIEIRWRVKLVHEEVPTAWQMDQFAQLMNMIWELQARLHDRLSAFEDDVWQGQEEAVMKTIKRVRFKKPCQ